MDFPNILLRGCLTSTEALGYVKHILGSAWRQDRGSQEDIDMGTMRPASVTKWEWGVQIHCHPYRNINAEWWDVLLSKFAETGIGLTRQTKLIVIHCIDILTPFNQRIVRKHLEDDYRSVRFILTAATDTILERSLESRCITMIHREPDEKPNLLPEPRDWEDARNMWLADIPAFRILDAFFQPEVERHPVGSKTRQEIILAWCRYADALKFSYQEINILTIAYQWIQQKRNPMKSQEPGSTLTEISPVKRVVRVKPATLIPPKEATTPENPKEPMIPKVKRGRPRKEIVSALGNILEFQ
jgi:hypothetical protein